MRLAQVRDIAIVYENNPAQSSADACGAAAAASCDGEAALNSPRDSDPQEWPAWAFDTNQGAVELCVQGNWYPGRWDPSPDSKWWRNWTNETGGKWMCFLYRWKNGKEYREGFPLSRVRPVSVAPAAIEEFCTTARMQDDEQRRDLYRGYCNRHAFMQHRSQEMDKAEDAWIKARREALQHPSVAKPVTSITAGRKPRREQKEKAQFDGVRMMQWNLRGAGGTQKVAAILHAAEVRGADVVILNEIAESVVAFRIRLQTVLSDFSIVGTGRVHKGGGGTAILARRQGCVRWSGGRPDREGEATFLRGHVGEHAFTIIGAYVTPNRTLADSRTQAKCDTLRSQTLASVARATAAARHRGDAVVLLGDLNAGFKAEQIKALDGPFAADRVAHNFTTPVSHDEFSVVQSWGLFLRSGLWGDEACASHTPSGHMLDQVWTNAALRTMRLEQLPVPVFTAPHPNAGKAMSDHAPIFVLWNPFPASPCPPPTNPPSQPRIRYLEWDAADRARYNWLLAQDLREQPVAPSSVRDAIHGCGAALVQCAEQVESERLAAQSGQKKCSTFWNEELIKARKLTRKLRREDRKSKERKAASRQLKILMAKRAAELAQTTAQTWVQGLKRDSKNKWKDIKTQKLLSAAGLMARVNAVRVGSLTSTQELRVVHDQAAAEEVAKYATRLNAQSWEAPGLEYDLDFACMYKALLGWRGVLLDRKAECAKYCDEQLELGHPLPKLCMEDISPAEVDFAIRRLKLGKAAGDDQVKNEQLTALDVMGRFAVTRLFALLFKTFACENFFSSATPLAWLTSLVQFLPKSSTKDTLDLKQQRGIRLLSCFGKLFRQVLARRLRVVTESMLHDSQALKHNEGCTTNALILTQKVGERLERSYATFVIFIDLVKAFDTVNRRLLWARYRRYGICGRLFWGLRAGYFGCLLKGRIGQFVSGCYRDDGAGVRQGDVDSSDGFALFIDDLDEEIAREEARVGRKLGIPLVGCRDSAAGDRIGCLKHADDTVVAAASAEDAQHLLNAVSRWCCKWQISPNAGKCKVVIFHPPRTPRPALPSPLTLIGEALEVVESVVYLGYLLHEHGTWGQHAERRVGIARDWDHIATQLLGHHGGATVGVAADVRRATAEVGSLYGAEFWGTSSPTPAQRAVDAAQATMAKSILGVRASAEAAGVLTELGWTATSVLAWQHRMLFWWRLGRTGSSLLKTLEWQSAATAQELDRTSEFNWFRVTRDEVQRLARDTGLTAAALRALPREDFRRLISRIAFAREFQERKAVFDASSRLRSFGLELATRKLRADKRCTWSTFRAPYLAHVSSRYHVRLLAMARLGLLPVEEEIGRWHRTPRAERWCTHCPGVLGTTRHFLRECACLASEPVPPWLTAATGEAAGAWWRKAARLLEQRWREKRAASSAASAQGLSFLASSAGCELEDDASKLENDARERLRFLDPGSGPPPNLACEIFTDGSKRPEVSQAGWGVWAVFLDPASSIPVGVLEAQGPVPDSSHTNMTGELWALLMAFREIQTLTAGSVCLVRFDCVPALMMAVGRYRPHKNADLVREVHLLYLEICTKYEVYFMHAKGHSGIFGNTRADTLADTGAELIEPTYSYLTPSDLGGTVRLSERYTPGDCGQDADLERKYAGKKRTKKSRTAQGVEDGHTRAIRNHLRHLGIHGAKAASILAGILDPAQALPAATCARSAA